MSVSVAYQSSLTVTETLTTGVPFAASNDNAITHNGLNLTATYTSATATPVTKVAAFEQALTAGAATIDLTALTGTNGVTVDGTGLKLQQIKVKGKSTNTAAITIAKGATNGYAPVGSAFSLTVPPGGEALLNYVESAADIAAGAKTLDLTGTGTETLQVIVVMG